MGGGVVTINGSDVPQVRDAPIHYLQGDTNIFVLSPYVLNIHPKVLIFSEHSKFNNTGYNGHVDMFSWLD